MILKIEYQNDSERTNLLNENSNLIIIEEQNVTEGNFLIFSDIPLEPRIIYTEVPEQEFKNLKSRQESTEEAVNFLLGL